MKKTFTVRRIVAAVMMLCVMASSVLPVMAQSTETQMVGGAITNIILRKWSEVGFEYLERGILRIMSETASATEGTFFGDAISLTKSILGNPTGTAVGKIQKTCNQILEELKVIEEQLDDIETKIDRLEVLMQSLITDVTEGQLQAQHEALVEFNTTYTGVYNVFANLVTALNNYADTSGSTESLKNLQSAYDAVVALYKDSDSGVITIDHNSREFNFTSDLDAFLSKISPYSATYSVNNNLEPYDTAGWGEKNSALANKTYMDYTFEYLKQASPIESTMYEAMSATYNEIASYAMMYLNAYRMYTEFGAQLINSTASTSRTDFRFSEGSTYTEAQKQAEINSLWEAYDENVYRVWRGIEQMLSLHQSTMDILMRPYDADFTIGMNYEDERVVAILTEEAANASDEVEYFKANTTESGAWLKAYQLKTYGNSRALCILQTKEQTVTLRDLTGKIGNQTVVDADWVNMQNSSSPYHYNMVKSITDLQPIYTAPGFSKTNNIYEFLDSQTNLDGSKLFPNLPKVDTSISDKEDGFMIPLYYLKSKRVLDQDKNVYVDADCYVSGLKLIGSARDQDLPFINISRDFNTASLEDSIITLDLEDKIRDDGENHTEAFITLTGETNDITPAFYVEAADGGTVTAQVKADGTQYAEGSRAVLKASTPMKIKIKPDEGKTIEYVSLHLKNSGKRVDLLSSSGSVTPSSEIPTVDASYVSDMKADSEGNYTVNVSVPYQDGWIEVGFTDDSSYEGKVNLSQTPSAIYDINGNSINPAGLEVGEVQFDTNNGITSKSVASGETVNVLVRPFTGYTVADIKITDAKGNTITATENKNAFTPAPTAKSYSFTMPESDVTVTASYKEGHTVTITQPLNGEVKFGNLMCADSNWLKYPVTFATDDLVRIDVEPDANYYFTTCDAVGAKSNEMPKDCAASYSETQRDKNGNSYETYTICFTAGATSVKEDYAVQVSCEAKLSGNYTVKLQAENESGLMYFLSPVTLSDGVTIKTDSDGKLMFKKIVANQWHYNAGDTVYVAYENREPSSAKPAITVSAGINSVEPVKLDIDTLSINEGKVNTQNITDIISFSMASGSNMTVSAAAQLATLKGNHKGDIFFVEPVYDEYGNAVLSENSLPLFNKVNISSIVISEGSNIYIAVRKDSPDSEPPQISVKNTTGELLAYVKTKGKVIEADHNDHIELYHVVADKHNAYVEAIGSEVSLPTVPNQVETAPTIKDIPNTGDAPKMLSVFSALLLAAVCGSICLLIRRKKSNNF